MTAQTMSTPDDISTVDLTDPRTFEENDLREYWRRLRTTRPLHWHPPTGDAPGFWVISRYADVMALYKDNKRLTSERGNVLVTLLAGGDSATGKMLAVTDGAPHRNLRNVLLKAFSPQALKPISDRVRQNTTHLVVEAVRRGECDFATDVAEHIPMNTISDLLGVPTADREFLLNLNKSALSSNEEGQSETDAWLARNEILLYFNELVAERRAKPTEDVISVLANSTVNGEPLSEEVIVLNCYSLILGGDETSRLSMIDAVRTLTRHPDQWQSLRDREVTLESATEEVLRWATPAMHFGRRAVIDVELHGQVIAAGDIVTLWNSSANQDEEVFADPYVFDLNRSPNKHITFGYGPHFCLGAYLGRVEVNAMLDALRTYSTGFEVTGEPQRIHSNFLTGLCSLPVRFEPDEAALAAYGSGNGARG
ncbi:cytochrome P450 [Streptomyces sp. NPDC088337]|uniref:cytochrome P450 n=1 Tax=unclassified Streptomyces TaxID=2593676 RepID=UPI002DD7FAA2|nr:cytochrome P450 [Streptomyces sp. NBC_01788]WSB30043.1 cytochrome P450 [Streptomyces sp. NBC_01788]